MPCQGRFFMEECLLDEKKLQLASQQFSFKIGSSLTYSHSFFLGGFFLFGLLLQLVVRHRDNSEDQVDEIEGSEEDDDDEEEHVPWSGRS